MGLDVRAWIIWVMAAATITMAARNPLYSGVLLLVAMLVARRGQQEETMLSLARLGPTMILFSAVFNLFWVHAGDHVLFRLPSGWPLIGGPYTAEAAVYGAANGVLLVALLAVFQAFNANVATGDLVRLVPDRLRDLGVVALIAITYIPETRRQLARVQQAQAIRGHRLQGWRDWQPIMVPLLVGGLERAMSVAETMVARGYGATTDRAQPLRVQLGMLLGVTAIVGGWLLAYWRPLVGWIAAGAGVLIWAAILWLPDRRRRRTRYAGRGWRRPDWVLAATSLLALVLVHAPLPWLDRSTLQYSPFPGVTWPAFDPVIGLGLALLALPALLRETGPAAAAGHDS